MKSFEEFKKALRMSESQTGVTNTEGCIGYFQFCNKTWRDIAGKLGYKGTKQDFIKNYSIQEKFLEKLIQENLKNLGVPSQYAAALSKRLNFNVTISGVVGGMHLGGVGGVQKLANKGIDKGDTYKTKVSAYVKKFSGYEIPNFQESEFDTFNEQNNTVPVTSHQVIIPTEGTAHQAIIPTEGTIEDYLPLIAVAGIGLIILIIATR